MITFFISFVDMPEEQRDVLLGRRDVLNSRDQLHRRGAIFEASAKWPFTLIQNKKNIPIPYIIDKVKTADICRVFIIMATSLS